MALSLSPPLKAVKGGYYNGRPVNSVSNGSQPNNERNRMADEQAKEEVETSEESPKEETSQEQPSEQVDDASEGDKTPTETDRGDLSVALKQEREKRQTLEAQANDPNFIYERAKALGMTEAEVKDEIQQEIQQQPAVQQPAPNIYGTVTEIMAYEKERDGFPQLKDDPDLQQMVDGFVATGLTPVEAVKKAKSIHTKAAKEVQAEDAERESKEVDAQNKAQTASGESDVNSDQQEYEQLIKDTRSIDSTVSDKANLELLKRKNKAAKIL